IALPEEYAFVDSETRQRKLQELDQKLTVVAKMQAQAVASAFTESLDNFIARLGGYLTNTQGKVNTSTVQQVLTAIDEYKSKTASLGILSDAEFSEIFSS